jgi:hypothetical protein
MNGRTAATISWISMVAIFGIALAVHPTDKDRAIRLSMGLLSVLASVWSLGALVNLFRGRRDNASRGPLALVAFAISAFGFVTFAFGAAYLLQPSFAAWVDLQLGLPVH